MGSLDSPTIHFRYRNLIGEGFLNQPQAQSFFNPHIRTELYDEVETQKIGLVQAEV